MTATEALAQLEACMTDGIAIRLYEGPAVHGELQAFVLSAWLLGSMEAAIGKRVRSLSREARRRARSQYSARWHREYERLLGRSRLALAYAQDDPDAWLGWACGDGGDRVHWLYVKRPFREHGLGKRLLYAAAPQAAGYTYPLPEQLTAVALRYGLTGPHGLRRETA